jgi:hypothetical protein
MDTEPHYPVSIRLQTDCFNVPEFGKHEGMVRRKLMVDGVPSLDISTPIPEHLWRGGFSIQVWAVDNLWYEGMLNCRVWFTTDTQDLNYRATRMTIKPRASVQVMIKDNDSALFKMRTANMLGTWGSFMVFVACATTGLCYIITVMYRAAQAVPASMGEGGEYRGEYRVPQSQVTKLTPPAMSGAWFLVVYAQLIAVSGKFTLVQKTAIVYQWIASRLDWTCFWFPLPAFIDDLLPKVEPVGLWDPFAFFVYTVSLFSIQEAKTRKLTRPQTPYCTTGRSRGSRSSPSGRPPRRSRSSRRTWFSASSASPSSW